jgi:outer membrane lipoprotein SlyB
MRALMVGVILSAVANLASAADAIAPSTTVTPVPPVTAPNMDACAGCGKVESIRQVQVRDQWTPLGSSASSGTGDGSPSGVSVYQIGKGFTNQGQVLLGAAGGGNYRTKPNELNATRWEVMVHMDAGGTRTVTQNYEPMLREGDKVRVSGRQIELLQ